MSIASEITRLQTAKANLKTAINNKGGSLTTETIDQYASKVSALPSPKAEETKTITPNFLSGNVVVTPTTDKVMTQVTVNKDTTNHIAENIKKDITLYGVTGTLESGGLPEGSFVVTANGTMSFTITGANKSNCYFIMGTSGNLFQYDSLYNSGWKKLGGLDTMTSLSTTSFRIDLKSYKGGSLPITYPSIDKIIVIEYHINSPSEDPINNTILSYRELTGYVYEYSPCFVRDTSIALSDGTYKSVQDITYNDNLLVWDFDKGEYGNAKPLWILKQKTTNKYTKLTFDDGTTLSLVGPHDRVHRVFDYDRGYFEYGDHLPIGARTFNNKGEIITLISIEVIYEDVDFYNIITDYHMNLFSNTVLTSCGYNNIYPIENMKFVKDERELIPIEDYNVDSKWYTGLRLGEQDLSLRSIEKAHKYIANMVQNDINQ